MEKLRLKVQLAFAFLFNIGFIQWHFFCFPVLNCHSCPISVFACPMGVIGQFAAVGIVPLTVIGTLVLAGVFVGRFLCGWACPFGFLQELLYKIPYVKFRIPPWTRFIKYGVFVGLVVFVPIAFSPNFSLYFCRVCPMGTIESAIPWAVINGTTDPASLSVRLFVLFTIVILALGHRRFFCKVLCPIGACLAMCNHLAAVFPRRQESCSECKLCNRVCPMTTGHRKLMFGVYEKRPAECISCLECQKRCPAEAIRLWG